MFKTCPVSWPFFLLLLMLGSLNAHLGLIVGSLGCHEADRKALLKFRHSLNDTKNQLSSWVGKDCCRWEGVGCDDVTSYVNRLDVHDPYFDQDLFYNPWTISAPKLDRSLVVLSHLNYLELSSIDFQGSQIPGFIGSFKHLRYLNLSYSNFGGVLPSQLSNLTGLQTLDLNWVYYSRDALLSSDPYWISYFSDALSSDLHWVSRLFNLQYLYISGVNISSFTNFEQLINMPSLVGLQLSNCHLNVPNFWSLFSNITLLSTIQHLDLSRNNFQGSFPAFVVNMTSLRYLDLSGNGLNGSIPLWLRITVSKLEHLDLSSNSLEGPLSYVLTNMTALTYLDLSFNKITSIISFWPRNLGKLEYLDLSHNLEGPLPRAFANMTSLTDINLSMNNFTGSIPLYIRNMGKLQNLGLGQNEFGQVEGGEVMGILGNLCNLISFDLSWNQIVGEIGAHHNLSNCITYDLEYLDLSYNMIGGTLSNCITYDLEYLDLSYNMIGGILPSWLGDIKRLRYLDVHNNSIEGSIPLSIGRLSYLESLDLSFNNLTGTIPEGLGQCMSLFFN